jgi:hypothetical protein
MLLVPDAKMGAAVHSAPVTALQPGPGTLTGPTSCQLMLPLAPFVPATVIESDTVERGLGLVALVSVDTVGAAGTSTVSRPSPAATL